MPWQWPRKQKMRQCIPPGATTPGADRTSEGLAGPPWQTPASPTRQPSERRARQSTSNVGSTLKSSPLLLCDGNRGFSGVQSPLLRRLVLGRRGRVIAPLERRHEAGIRIFQCFVDFNATPVVVVCHHGIGGSDRQPECDETR